MADCGMLSHQPVGARVTVLSVKSETDRAQQHGPGLGTSVGVLLAGGNYASGV